MQPGPSNWHSLKDRVLSNEEWLMNRVLRYALERGYTKYTSTLAEAWRMSIAGLSAAIVAALEKDDAVPELGPDDEFVTHPMAAFGVMEAEKHRARGITLGMFLGLMKYYQESYADLVREAGWPREEEERALLFLRRFFDFNEIGFSIAWTRPTGAEGITELQDANRTLMNEKNRYLTLFESLSSPAVLLGRDGSIDYLNEAAASLLKEYGVEGPGYYVPGAMGTRLAWLEEDLSPILGGERDEVEVEKRIETGAGPRDFRVLLKRMLDVSEKFQGVVVLMNEVTELRRAAEALERARDTAEAAGRAKSVFLANMSHEIRTPLNAIIGFSELLERDGSLLPEQRRNLRTINRSGEHLLSLVNDVLDMAKIEAGRMTLAVQPFDLPRLLTDLEAMFRLRASDRGLGLSFGFPAGLPRIVEGDGGKLRQILINLLGNAVKFTAAGRVSLRAEVEEDGPECRVGFVVEDTGPGISPGEIARIFGAFQQAEAGLRAQEGTGLGLSISGQFARLMGGTLGAESEPGKGSRFRLSLPLRRAEGEVHPERTAPRATALVAGQPRFKVLVVDDRQVNRELLRQMLVPVGFRVREAANGQEALSRIVEERPDIVLMDVVMPVMDGRVATRIIRSRDPGLPIVAISASVFAEDAREILALGANSFIRKPFRSAEVLGEIARQVGAEFVYEGVEETSCPGPAPVSFTGLPADLLGRLRAAAERLDRGAVGECLPELGRSSPALEGWVGECAANYAFECILDAMEEALPIEAVR